MNNLFMRIYKLFILFFLVVFNHLLVSAQDDEIIKIDSSIVRLNVGVVNGKGQPITNLSKENFTVYEDGVKQNISRFEPTVAPFSVVILLDMSGSTLGFRETIRQSAFRFVDALASEDRVAVVEFYDKVNLRNDFTTDRRKIGNSIIAANGRGKTQLYKALDFALEKLSGEGKRRKAVIVLTDGVDTDARDNDRGFLEKISKSEISSAIKPETSDILNRILNKSDAQGVTIYPLALPTGDPFKLADPTPSQIAMFSAARKFYN
jgi:VWFA-related protein